MKITEKCITWEAEGAKQEYMERGEQGSEWFALFPSDAMYHHKMKGNDRNNDSDAVSWT